MEGSPEVHQKSINNAVSAYLMILISWAFLLNSSNQYLKNDFVRSHTKVAFLTHLSFLLTFVIFVWFDFLRGYSFLGFSINYIIATLIFTGLFLFLLYWIYSATRGEKFAVWDIVSVAHNKKIIDINGDMKVDEKDLITLIFAHIPFLWYIVYGSYYKVESVKQIVHVNLFVSILITAIFILWYNNIALLLSLLYIIFIVFSSMSILVRGSLVGIDASMIPSPEQKIVLQKTLWKYMKNYFWKKDDFVWFSELKEQVITSRNEYNQEKLQRLQSVSEYRLPRILTYIPFINIINIFSLKTKLNTHIINGLYLTVISMIIIALSYFGFLTIKLLFFVLFPVCFWIGFIQSKQAYMMPYVYDLHVLIIDFFSFFKRSKKTIKEKQKEEHHTTFSVGDELHDEEKTS